MKNRLSQKPPVTAATVAIIVLAFFFTTCEIGDPVKIPSYTIVYNGNGGTGSMGKSIHKYGTETNLSANAFTCEGYGFSGWAEEPAGAVKYQDKQSIKNLTNEDGATILLYAVWTPAYSLTVDIGLDGGGTVSPSGTSTHAAGAEVTVTATPDSYMYAFVKWTGPGAPQGTAANNPIITVTMNSDLILTANFRLKTEISHVELFSNPGSTPWQLPGDVTFPATVEVYALGAGGGGQGGHMYDNYYIIYVDTKTGTGGAGGGGAAAYMKFETYTQEVFTINVGSGGTRGSRIIRTLFEDWRSGGAGGKGGDTTVTWSGGTLAVQGGQGGGSPASDTNLSGGASGNASTRPAAITLANWESPASNNGANGVQDGKRESRGGDSAALKLTKGWFDFRIDPDSYYKGGWNDFGAEVAYYPGTGAGGSGGWGENNGIAGGNGQVRIRVTWYE